MSFQFFKLAANAALALTLAASLSASLSAQSLDGQVVRNPDDTVTYTIDIDGPPRGQAALFLSPNLWTPIQIPGFLNSLYLDPLFLVPLGGVSFGLTGPTNLNFTVPATTALDLPLYFQAIVLDQGGRLAFSQNYLMLTNHSPGR